MIRLRALLFPLVVAGASSSAIRAETLVELEGDLHVVGPGLEVADRIGDFRVESSGAGDLRETPGPAALVVPGAGAAAGELVGAPLRVNEVRRVDPASGRPLAAGAADGASCITGVEPACLPLDECRPGPGGPSLPCSVAGSVEAFQALDGLSLGSFLVPGAGLLTLSTSLNSAITGNPIDPANVLVDFDLSLSEFLANVFAGNSSANTVLSGGIAGTTIPSVSLRADPCDGFLSDCVTAGPGGSTFLGQGGATLNALLTPAQQAHLGCGEFYATNCELEGVALLNGEAGALLQCLGSVGPDWDFGDASVVQPCTVGWDDALASCQRPHGDSTVVLPGCRRPGDPGYDPLVDGAPTGLLHPLTNQPFASEMAALSFNFVMTLVVLTTIDDPTAAFPDPSQRLDPTDPLRLDGCSFRKPQLCRSFLHHAFTEQRADDPGGPPRRRWIWETGADYDVTAATGLFLGGFLGWSLHAIGPEPSRAGDGGEGVLFLLAPPEAQDPCEPPPFPVPDSPFIVEGAGCDGDLGSDDDRPLGVAYGLIPAPEPAQLLLQAIAFGTLVLIGRSGRRAR
jgi:hypothetical protein